MTKVNKAKARRLAKEQKSAANSRPRITVLYPKSSSSSRMAANLQPAFAFRNENQDVLTKLALGITRLRLGVGTEEDLGFMYGRVLFGRRIAYAYFEGQLVDVLHHALQTIVLVAKTQVATSTAANISITETQAQEISDALQAIEVMAGKITPEQYMKQALEHQTSPMLQPELQLQDFEQVKEDEDFLASVKTQSSQVP